MNNSTCKWSGCETTKIFCREMCQKHYVRSRRIGTFDEPWVLWEKKKNPDPVTCRWPDCAENAKHRGLCARDYTRAYRRNNFDNPWEEWEEPGRLCKWPECNRIVDYHGFCDMHCKRAIRLNNFDSPWD